MSSNVDANTSSHAESLGDNCMAESLGDNCMAESLGDNCMEIGGTDWSIAGHIALRKELSTILGPDFAKAEGCRGRFDSKDINRGAVKAFIARRDLTGAATTVLCGPAATEPAQE
jgi:hypothetical protein